MSMRKTPPPRVPKVDTRKVAELVASLVIGHIRERCESGVDIDGKPFLAYADDYRDTRLALGRNASTVDLLMTGGLMGSVQVVERTDDTITLGLGTGTSSQRRAPTKGNRRKRAGEKRGPPHNLLGQWHQDGAGHNKRRRWFGVSKQGDEEVKREASRRKPPLI